MRWVAEHAIIVTGIFIGFLLFVAGMRRELKQRDAKSVKDKILIAASITIISLSSANCSTETTKPTCYAPPLQKQTNANAEIDKRIAEITESKEWPQLRADWNTLQKIIKIGRDTRLSNSETNNIACRTCYAIERYQELKPDQQGDDADLLSKEEAITELQKIIAFLLFQNRLYSLKNVEIPFTKHTKYIQQQMELFEKQFKQGKITRVVYDKVKNTVDMYHLEKQIAEGMNRKNSALIFGLIKSLCKENDAREDVSPDITKRIEEVTKSPEWGKMLPVWKDTLGLLKSNQNLTEELKKWQTQAAADLHQEPEYGKLDNPQQEAESAPLLSVEETVAEIKYLMLEMTRHIRRLHISTTCYMRVLPRQTNLIKDRETLLEKQFVDGKISKDLYLKIRNVMEAYKFRGTVIAEKHNRKNSVLIFELLKIIAQDCQ